MATSTTGKTNPPVDMSTWRREMQAKRIKFDDEQKKLYCMFLSETGLKGVAAFKAGVALSTVQAHLKNDPDFTQAVDEAWAARTEQVMVPLEREALEGHIEKTVHGEGEDRVERTRKVLETQLRLAMMKKYDREGYGNVVEEVVTGGIGGAIMVPARFLTEEEWEAAYSPKEAPPPIEDDEDGDI